MQKFDVVVVGGGLIGSLIAFRLAQENLSVALLDQGAPGRESSWAAAGILSPAPDSAASIPLVPFGWASLHLYPDLIAEVEELTGMSTGYRREGSIELIFSANAERELSTLIALHHGLGLPTEPLPLDEARKLEPAITSRAQAAALLPYEGAVDNRAFTGAVLAAAKASGVTIHPDTRVERIIREANLCVGVAAGGNKFMAGKVVLAAGAFTGLIEGLLPVVSTRPVRGQMAALRHSGVRVRRPIRCDRGYIVPRDDASPQRIVAGATVENAGFEKRVTPYGLEHVFSTAQELIPGLADAKIVETWSGLRPDSPDHLPLLGPAALDNLILATGHYRNGILLAPITAKLVREWIVEQRVSMDWDLFSPLRFEQVRAAE